MPASKKASAKKQSKAAIKKGDEAPAPAALSFAGADLFEGESTTLDTVYILNDSSATVTLEINAGGEKQSSDMTVKLGSIVLAQALAGDFTKRSIGTNRELDGKKLSIAATVTDTSREHNFTSLTIRLKGGAADTDFPLNKTVNKDGESADYLCLIEFFKP